MQATWQHTTPSRDKHPARSPEFTQQVICVSRPVCTKSLSVLSLLSLTAVHKRKSDLPRPFAFSHCRTGGNRQALNYMHFAYGVFKMHTLKSCSQNTIGDMINTFIIIHRICPNWKLKRGFISHWQYAKCKPKPCERILRAMYNVQVRWKCCKHIKQYSQVRIK